MKMFTFYIILIVGGTIAAVIGTAGLAKLNKDRGEADHQEVLDETETIKKQIKGTQIISPDNITAAFRVDNTDIPGRRPEDAFTMLTIGITNNGDVPANKCTLKLDIDYPENVLAEKFIGENYYVDSNLVSVQCDTVKSRQTKSISSFYVREFEILIIKTEVHAKNMNSIKKQDFTIRYIDDKFQIDQITVIGRKE